MTQNRNTKPYDLEEGTFTFAKMTRALVRKLKKSAANIKDGKQLIRASRSIGANYIEAQQRKSENG